MHDCATNDGWMRGYSRMSISPRASGGTSLPTLSSVGAYALLPQRYPNSKTGMAFEP